MTHSSALRALSFNTLLAGVNDFRLSGVTATPVMTADNASLSTLYLTPYKGSALSLYDGTAWGLYTLNEISIAVTGCTTDLPFDVFVYDNAGTATLELLDWASATARATAIVRQDGVWSKSGALTRRYVGSVRPRSATTYSWVITGVTTSSGAGTTARLDLFNVDNQVTTFATQTDTTNTWTYSTAAFRQANASTTNQIDIMVGVAGGFCRNLVFGVNVPATASTLTSSGVGYDSTSTNIAQIRNASRADNTAEAQICTALANHQPAVGRHFYAWLEYAVAVGTTTWWGDNNSTTHQSGMSSIWNC